jgi:coenzyme Q-binding protein COQ10
MPDLFLERHVPHLADRMFDLVSDLPSYPRFIPNCKDMQVKRDDSAQGDVRFARMTIQFGPVTQAYTSRVEADRSAHTIVAKAVDGPFSTSTASGRSSQKARERASASTSTSRSRTR